MALLNSASRMSDLMYDGTEAGVQWNSVIIANDTIIAARSCCAMNIRTRHAAGSQAQ